MGFRPMERITLGRGWPSLTVGRTTGGTPFVQVNYAALSAMGYQHGETAHLILAWDSDLQRIGVAVTNGDSQDKYVRNVKVNRSIGVKISIGGESRRYAIPIDDISGRYSLQVDKQSEYWVADCGRGVNKGAIRSRMRQNGGRRESTTD